MEENSYNLEQMLADYKALKETLDKQEIINDKLLRETMRNKVSSIRNRAGISIACGIFVILIAPFAFHFNPVCNASWWFVGATDIMMAVCIFFDWKFNHKVQSADLASCNLLEFSKDVKQMKMNYKNWLYAAFPIMAVWVGWFAAEVWIHSEEPKLAIAMMAGLAAGVVAGGTIGYLMNRKITKTCDEIIENIEQ